MFLFILNISLGIIFNLINFFVFLVHTRTTHIFKGIFTGFHRINIRVLAILFHVYCIY